MNKRKSNKYNNSSDENLDNNSDRYKDKEDEYNKSNKVKEEK